MSFWKAVSIISWTIERYESAKKWLSEKVKVWRSRNIRNEIDSGNTDAIDKRVRRIKQKRRNRFDAS